MAKSRPPGADPDKWWQGETEKFLRTALCILCDSPNVVMLGLFVPDDPDEFPGGLVSEGKERVIMYATCARCIAKHRGKNKLATAVEEKLLSTKEE